MHRREFLGAAAAAGLNIGLPEMNRHEPQPTPFVPGVMKHKYWVWDHTNEKAAPEALKAKYSKLKGHGLHGVFLGGPPNDREYEIVKAAGLELHVWMWTTNRGDEWIRKNHPDWYQVSRTGKSCFDHPPYVNYYRWISPVIPGVQDYVRDRAAELAVRPTVDGVHLDYVRYPDVILPRGLWAKYHLDQTEELPDYDFCYSEHTRAAFKAVSGRDPVEIADPASDQEWLHFRYDSVTKLVEKVAKEVHRHKKLLTAAVFPTPRMARTICRQAWDRWPLDAACPMIYHGFYNEGVDWIGERVLEDVQAVDFPIYAGIYMPDLSSVDDFTKALHLARKRGAAGVSMFGGVSDAHWVAFEKAIG
ncbi:MAG TPA: putative glycoside hydrolase [Fimbriimonadaceae bacterium]|nr:putative glycoside hydrolase [Fimbriimonadaceae bacterium]